MKRLFVAVEIPDNLKSELKNVQKELMKSDFPMRWIDVSNIHLTLKFLGNTDEKDIIEVDKVLMSACSDYVPFSLEISGLGAFPNLSKPNVIWAGVNCLRTPLMDFQKFIESELTKKGFLSEKRSYFPHLSLGRRVGKSDNVYLMQKLIDQYANRKLGIMSVRSVVLFESVLQKSGARYFKLASYRL